MRPDRRSQSHFVDRLTHTGKTAFEAVLERRAEAARQRSARRSIWRASSIAKDDPHYVARLLHHLSMAGLVRSDDAAGIRELLQSVHGADWARDVVGRNRSAATPAERRFLSDYGLALVAGEPVLPLMNTPNDRHVRRAWTRRHETSRPLWRTPSLHAEGRGDGPMRAPAFTSRIAVVNASKVRPLGPRVQLKAHASAAMGTEPLVAQDVRALLQPVVQSTSTSYPSRSQLAKISPELGTLVGDVRAYVGNLPERRLLRALDAEAMAFDERHALFARSPTLHVAAHEAIHLAQQRSGRASRSARADLEKQADRGADLVVAGDARGFAAWARVMLPELNARSAPPAQGDATGFEAAHRALVATMGERLGLSPDEVDVRLDDDAQRRAAASGGPGVMEGGVVYLDGRHYDPTTSAGRYTVAHELTHVAQRKLTSGDVSPIGLAAEVEATTFARSLANGEWVGRPQHRLPANARAAHHITDVKAARKRIQDIERQISSQSLPDKAVADLEREVRELEKVIRGTAKSKRMSAAEKRWRKQKTAEYKATKRPFKRAEAMIRSLPSSALMPQGSVALTRDLEALRRRFRRMYAKIDRTTERRYQKQQDEAMEAELQAMREAAEELQERAIGAARRSGEGAPLTPRDAVRVEYITWLYNHGITFGRREAAWWSRYPQAQREVESPNSGRRSLKQWLLDLERRMQENLRDAANPMVRYQGRFITQARGPVRYWLRELRLLFPRAERKIADRITGAADKMVAEHGTTKEDERRQKEAPFAKHSWWAELKQYQKDSIVRAYYRPRLTIDEWDALKGDVDNIRAWPTVKKMFKEAFYFPKAFIVNEREDKYGGEAILATRGKKFVKGRNKDGTAILGDKAEYDLAYEGIRNLNSGAQRLVMHVLNRMPYGDKIVWGPRLANLYAFYRTNRALIHKVIKDTGGVVDAGKWFFTEFPAMVTAMGKGSSSVAMVLERLRGIKAGAKDMLAAGMGIVVAAASGRSSTLDMTMLVQIFASSGSALIGKLAGIWGAANGVWRSMRRGLHKIGDQHKRGWPMVSSPDKFIAAVEAGGEWFKQEELEVIKRLGVKDLAKLKVRTFGEIIVQAAKKGGVIWRYLKLLYTFGKKVWRKVISVQSKLGGIKVKGLALKWALTKGTDRLVEGVRKRAEEFKSSKD